MIWTSFSIVPALYVARHADFVDLDGEIWLAQDRGGGMVVAEDQRLCPQPGFWGEPR